MLHIDTHSLNKKIFDTDVQQEPIRKGFGEGLLIAGRADSRVVGLCADLTESTYMHLFKKEFPQRFIEIGVAEQNLATVASGLAAAGKIPFITSYAMFSPGRNWEQIRTTISYNDVPVKIAGSHAGISVGPDGGTHQAIEDMALMRLIPNMIVISPCDSIEAKKATIATAKNNHPTYIRLAREKTPIITTEETPFEIGKAIVLFGIHTEPHDVTLIATGSLVFNALVAAKKLDEEGIRAVVINVHTIKPLDTETLVSAITQSRAVVTIEEHQTAGGLGGAVAEMCSEIIPVPIERIGVRDQFGQSGKPSELITHYGMDVDTIVRASGKVIARKK
jgi:transketolase